MNQAIKKYLNLYNAAAFIFWLAYAAYIIAYGFSLNATGLLLLSIAQGMAFLEIVHAFLKWVKSPLVSTIAQVSSRIFIVVLLHFFINDLPLPFLTQTGITVISVAWGITEMVRYSFYTLQLIDVKPYVLLWMRYSFFIVLYPLGVSGEWFILLHPVMKSGLVFSAYNLFLIVILAAYIYYFPVLYRYMWRQRKSKLKP